MQQHRRPLLAFVASVLVVLLVRCTNAAVSFADCGAEPCILPLPQPCSHYVEKSYLFSGSCCSLSASDNGCLLTVSDGSCDYTAGEPGSSLACETVSGDLVNCFQHAHEPEENICRAWNDDSIIFNMTEFVSCGAVPSFTATTLVSSSNETCPESEYPLRPDTTWTPSIPVVETLPSVPVVETAPSVPVVETPVEMRAASNAANVRLVMELAASSAAIVWLLA